MQEQATRPVARPEPGAAMKVAAGKAALISGNTTCRCKGYLHLKR